MPNPRMFSLSHLPPEGETGETADFYLLDPKPRIEFLLPLVTIRHVITPRPARIGTFVLCLKTFSWSEHFGARLAKDLLVCRALAMLPTISGIGILQHFC